ncbi:hypothetical protein [Sediminicoccus rosea]|uniref:Lipoprotein n=1 Tax=Sediminicoccus rosea TaxID=1225128 RepID=A0ABZ0PKM2_9PROT|nr:hypothetical protein [Sediminicoccus rosea]WPB86120.1 hypothetical protein R9Z33_04430 [Sediminicoccus rosea]
MTTLLPRRAAFALAALLLAGCSASFGPAATRDGTSRLQPLLLPEDGPLELALPARWVNARTIPSLADSLLLGARPEPPVVGVVALTERSLIGASWTGETRGYVLSFRIPYREIVAIAPVGPRTDIFGNFIGGLSVETNAPRHIALGQPPRTGLYRIFPDEAEIVDMLRERAPQAGTNPQ